MFIGIYDAKKFVYNSTGQVSNYQAHNKLAGVSSGMPGSAPFWNPEQEKIMLLHSHCYNNHHTEVDDGGYEAPMECSLANIEDGGDPVLDSLAQ